MGVSVAANDVAPHTPRSVTLFQYVIFISLRNLMLNSCWYNKYCPFYFFLPVINENDVSFYMHSYNW
jgi:hypothetical protein